MQNFDQLKQQSNDAIYYLDTNAAKELIREIDFNLKKLLEAPENNGQKVEEYFSLLIRLKLVRLPFLKDSEMIKFIKESLTGILNMEEINIMERIETRQLLFPRETRHEMVNQPIIEALHQNEEMLGDEKIFVEGNPEAQEPTVENWLLDYDRAYGTEPQKDLVWLEYMNSGANASRLETKEKETLRKLLKFYEFLKPEYIQE